MSGANRIPLVPRSVASKPGSSASFAFVPRQVASAQAAPPHRTFSHFPLPSQYQIPQGLPPSDYCPPEFGPCPKCDETVNIALDCCYCGFSPPPPLVDGPLGDLGITRDEMEQWQAGYVYKPKDTTTDSSTKPQPAPAMPPQPNKTVMREGGGKKWEDKTLLEWDPSHYRLFVGNLAGEVTDDTLQRSFKQYPSLVKARVIRDKRTTKSKGYGFVSFSDGSDYMAAGKDMHEKYIGGRPVQIKRAKASIVPVDIESEKKKGKGNKKDAGGHANTGAGVTKKYKRTPVSHPSGLKPIA